MLTGLNCDPAKRPDLATIIDGRTCYVRFPLRRGRDYRPFVRRLQAVGIEPLAILTDEWFSRSEQREQRWEDGARAARQQYPSVQYWQAGNEEDQRGESSEFRPSWVYEPFIAAVRRGLGTDVILIGGGAASGDPNYFDHMGLSCLDAFAVHVYAQTPHTVGPLLRSYRRFGLPIWVTEMGLDARGYDSEHERAVELSQMVRALANNGVQVALYYCLQHRQGGPLALLDEQSNATESWAAWVGGGRLP